MSKGTSIFITICIWAAVSGGILYWDDHRRKKFLAEDKENHKIRVVGYLTNEALTLVHGEGKHASVYSYEEGILSDQVKNAITSLGLGHLLTLDHSGIIDGLQAFIQSEWQNYSHEPIAA